MKLDVVDKENKKLEEFEIADSVLTVEAKDNAVHDVILAYQQNQHNGSSNTLTRAEVRGGGRKPWKQKGTGRARHGSNRSPIWKGGGVTFGPRPLKARMEVPKKQKKAAMQMVVAGKLKDGEIKIINTMDFKQPKTKDVSEMLKKMKLNGKKVLFVLEKADNAVVKSVRNIRNADIITSKNLNVYDLMVNSNILVTKKSMEEIIRRIG